MLSVSKSAIDFIRNNIKSKNNQVESKAYTRFKKIYDDIDEKDADLESLLEKFRLSNDDKGLASQIAVILAKKAGKT